MTEFNTLNAENKKQHSYVNNLKGLVEQEVKPARRLMKQSQQVGTQIPKDNQYYNRAASRSKGRGLFTSNNLGKASSSKLLLKKVRSS